MRTNLLTVGVLTAVCLALAVGSAQASTIEVKVPFPFLVHEKSLPAGQYLVTDDGVSSCFAVKRARPVDRRLGVADARPGSQSLA